MPLIPSHSFYLSLFPASFSFLSFCIYFFLDREPGRRRYPSYSSSHPLHTISLCRASSAYLSLITFLSLSFSFHLSLPTSIFLILVLFPPLPSSLFPSSSSYLPLSTFSLTTFHSSSIILPPSFHLPHSICSSCYLHSTSLSLPLSSSLSFLLPFSPSPFLSFSFSLFLLSFQIKSVTATT